MKLEQIEFDFKDLVTNQDIKKFYPLVKSTVNKFSSWVNLKEDMEQEGLYGLVRGLQTFDSKKAKLLPYLKRCIKNQISNYLIDNGTTISVPNHLSRKILKNDGFERFNKEIKFPEICNLEDVEIPETIYDEEVFSLNECIDNLDPKNKFMFELKLGRNPRSEYSFKDVLIITKIPADSINLEYRRAVRSMNENIKKKNFNHEDIKFLDILPKEKSILLTFNNKLYCSPMNLDQIASVLGTTTFKIRKRYAVLLNVLKNKLK